MASNKSHRSLQCFYWVSHPQKHGCRHQNLISIYPRSWVTGKNVILPVFVVAILKRASNRLFIPIWWWWHQLFMFGGVQGAKKNWSRRITSQGPGGPSRPTSCSIFVYTEHAKFQKASFNNNWDVKQWNKMLWINTFNSPSTFLCYNFSFGSIPSPHQVHSCAIILVLDQYLHLTEYILVL